MIRLALLIILSLNLSIGTAQELYPHTEPASSVPKGVLGIRVASEFYDEIGQLRSWQGYKFMFGLTPRLTLVQTFTFSNHHGSKLPDNFISNDGNIGLHTHGTTKGRPYPYAFESLNLYMKYRILSKDGKNRHFRMAAYFEAAGGNEAHDEAEPSLSGDNGGLGGGMIATWLNKKLAVSATAGYIMPSRYKQRNPEIVVQYGDAVNYSLSFGYLVFPRQYRDYKQTNINFYVEFLGKRYDAAKIEYQGQPIYSADVYTLARGSYIEARPSLQFIFKSNLRIDLSAAWPFRDRSFVRSYPAYYVNVQRYFYF